MSHHSQAKPAPSSRRRTALLGVVALLAAGGAAWALWDRDLDVAMADPNEVARAFNENRDAMTDVDRRAAMDRMGTLSDEEKATLDPDAQRMARWAGFRQQAQETVDNYFKTPLDQREAYLDETIDRLQEMRKEMEKRRAERQAEREAAGEAGQRPDRGERGGRGGGWGGRDGGNSANQAQRVEFMAALMKRANERGIDFGGMGPGGWRGGRGGN